MNNDLRLALERIGYDQLYEALIPGLRAPNPRGERIARTPFPDTVDDSPSFTVNILSGLWYCNKTKRGGNYVQFLAHMNATEFDPETGRCIPAFNETERDLIEQMGIAAPIEESWVDECCNVLMSDLLIQQAIQNTKPWLPHALRLLNIGYDGERHRVVIPCYDRRGKLINARMYQPGGVPKFVWKVSNLTGNFLLPRQAWNESVIILVEGEPDMISLRSHAFSAASGTMGSGNPVPEGMWWRGKHVYLWMDDDEAGRTATREAIRIMQNEAASIHVVPWPVWDGKKDNADPSDLIQHLYSIGYDFAGVQTYIGELLGQAQEAQLPHHVYDQDAEPRSFTEALSSANLGVRIEFPARVAARSEERYLLPVAYELTCPAGGHQYCGRCPMRSEFHGNGEFTHDPRAADSLKLIKVSQRDQLETVKDAQGIPGQCPDVTMRVTRTVDVEPTVINATILEGEGEEVSRGERQRREAYVILRGNDRVEENRDYRLSGFTYPHPKTQSGVFLVDRFEGMTASYDQFQMTDELLEGLTIFRPHQGQPVLEKLRDVAQDLEDAVTRIHGRMDLHLAYRTVWHSCLRFPLGAAWVERGWIEALVIGDTRCGKSAAFRKMAAWYNQGLLVDCKLQSSAGLLGSVVTSQSTGERYCVAGIFPQQDGLGPVCMDEFHVPRWGGGGIIEAMSSTRAEGIVRISKAASAQFHARVRSIWLANPGMGQLITELGQSGVELIARLIKQPEDIARFDIALTVAQADVDYDLVNQLESPAEARYSRDLARSLMMWAWSRKADQIEFTEDAQKAVMAMAKSMYERYDATIPLVEPADQRTRVAKVAVSIAAQCFSSDDTGSRLIVRPEHVYAAGQLFQIWYDKPVMAYHTYSERQRQERTLGSEADVQNIFDVTAGQHGRLLATQLLRLDEFTERTFGTLVPIPTMATRTMLQTLYANRAIRLVGRGRKESYEVTAPFIAWLKRYLAS